MNAKTMLNVIRVGGSRVCGGAGLFLLSALIARAAEPAAGGVTLNIFSQPDAAAIIVDGKPRGHTPQTLRELPADQTFTVRLEAEGFQPLERSFNLPPRKVETWDAELIPLHPGIEITTQPGAQVDLVGENDQTVSLGVADEKGILISTGRVSGTSCTLRITKDGYETLEQKVTLDLRAQTKVSLTLRPKPGRLRIVSAPPVTEILVNGAKRTLDGGLVDIVADTDVTVELQPVGYRPEKKTVKVGRGAELTVNFGNLVALSGSLRILVQTPEGPVAPDFFNRVRVTVDGDDYTATRGLLEGVPAGERKIALFNPDYDTGDEQAVVVKEKEEAKLSFDVRIRPASVRIKNSPAIPYQVRLGGALLEGRREGNDLIIEVPPSTAPFVLDVSADRYLPVSQTFDAILPRSEVEWPGQLVLKLNQTLVEQDRAAEAARIEAAAMKELLERLDNELQKIQGSAPMSDESYSAHKAWVDKIEADNAKRLNSNQTAARKLSEIRQILERRKPAAEIRRRIL